MNSKRTSTPAERLREALERSGKKQADLVRMTGLDRGSVSSYLAGKYEPKQKAVYKMAAALDVSEMWLLGYDVPMARTAEQKKNDDLAQVVVKLRSDADFYTDVYMLSGLQPADRAAIHQLLVTLYNK